MRTVLLVVVLAVSLAGCMKSSTTMVDPDGLPRTDDGAFDLAHFGVNGDPFRGNSTAPVQVVAYDAPGCPNCARYHSNVLPGILADFADTDQIGYHYLQYTVGYGYDMEGGVAAECAYREGGTAAYEQMTDKLFSTMYQSRKIPGHLRAVAETHGLDDARLQSCYADEETRDEVSADINAGRDSGAGSNPGFAVIGPNGVAFVKGAGGPRAAIEAALAEVS